MIMRIPIMIIVKPIMKKVKRHPTTLTETKQAKIFKQIIMTPHHYPPIFLPRFTILNPAEKQLYKIKGTAQDWTLKLKRTSKSMGNITSMMGYYPRNL